MVDCETDEMVDFETDHEMVDETISHNYIKIKIVRSQDRSWREMRW